MTRLIACDPVDERSDSPIGAEKKRCRRTPVIRERANSRCGELRTL
jgi:hypothetical protein